MTRPNAAARRVRSRAAPPTQTAPQPGETRTAADAGDRLVGPETHERVFAATLGARERLITYAVGYGVGIGVPLILGVAFAVGFAQPLLLLFPLPFALVFGIPVWFRPTAYSVSTLEIAVNRPIGRWRIPLDTVRAVHSPATNPPGSRIGLARVDGIHGTFGSYWNKEWGRYRVFVTNPMNTVEVRLGGGRRVILSPDDPGAFVAAIREVAGERGVPIEVSCL